MWCSCGDCSMYVYINESALFQMPPTFLSRLACGIIKTQANDCAHANHQFSFFFFPRFLPHTHKWMCINTGNIRTFMHIPGGRQREKNNKILLITMVATSATFKLSHSHFFPFPFATWVYCERASSRYMGI